MKKENTLKKLILEQKTFKTKNKKELKENARRTEIISVLEQNSDGLTKRQLCNKLNGLLSYPHLLNFLKIMKKRDDILIIKQRGSGKNHLIKLTPERKDGYLWYLKKRQSIKKETEQHLNPEKTLNELINFFKKKKIDSISLKDENLLDKFPFLKYDIVRFFLEGLESNKNYYDNFDVILTLKNPKR